MYKEVALDPRCLAEFHYYGLLKSEFGTEKGRFLVAPVKEWVREAVKSVKQSQLSPIKQKSITNFLNRLQRDKSSDYVYLPEDRRAQAQDQQAIFWLDWTRQQHSYRPFCSRISESGLAGYIDYSAILDNEMTWHVAPTRWLEKTPQSLATAIRPLLHLGRDLVIADPYFKLPSNPVLKDIFAYLQHYNIVKKIEIVTTMACADVHKVFTSEYRSKFNYLPTIVYTQMDQGALHDRYMFTEKAMIKAGQGFAIAPQKGLQSDKLSVSLCGAEEALATRTFIQEYKKKHPQATMTVN